MVYDHPTPRGPGPSVPAASGYLADMGSRRCASVQHTEGGGEGVARGLPRSSRWSLESKVSRTATQQSGVTELALSGRWNRSLLNRKEKQKQKARWPRGRSSSLVAGAALSCLVHFDVLFMGKVERGHEEVHEIAPEASGVQVVGHDLADKVLAGAGPAVQRQGQRFLGVFVVLEAAQRLENYFRGQMLSEQLLQVQLEGYGATGRVLQRTQSPEGRSTCPAGAWSPG